MAKNRSAKEPDKIEEALDQGHHALARELGRRYVEKYPSDSEGKWLYGQAVYLLDRNAEARALIEEALPELSDDLQIEALSILGDIAEERNDLPTAERLYRKAIDADPGDSSSYVDLASLLLKSDRRKEAEEMALKGIQAEAVPAQPLHLFLGGKYRSDGEVVRAFESYQAANAEEEGEEAVTALDDLEALAELLGIDLPLSDEDEQESDGDEEMQDDEDEEADEDDDIGDEDAEHEPGHMVAHIH